MALINKLYYWLATRSPAAKKTSLFEFLFPAVGKEFYFDFFGDPGFVELPVLISEAAIDENIPAFRKCLESYARPIALTTIKAFRGEHRLLHYNGNGFSFTLDVEATPESLKFLQDLDEINTRFGGRTAIMKDSRLRADIVRRQYPEYDSFRERLRAYDPKRQFVSELSSRLEL